MHTDKKENQRGNYAFIDGQNLYMGTAKLEENRLEKVLFPNKKFASSLYKKLGSQYFDYLDNEGIKGKIGTKKKRAP